MVANKGEVKDHLASIEWMLQPLHTNRVDAVIIVNSIQGVFLLPSTNSMRPAKTSTAPSWVVHPRQPLVSAGLALLVPGDAERPEYAAFVDHPLAVMAASVQECVQEVAACAAVATLDVVPAVAVLPSACSHPYRED